jgi:hypothetical protein
MFPMEKRVYPERIRVPSTPRVMREMHNASTVECQKGKGVEIFQFDRVLQPVLEAIGSGFANWVARSCGQKTAER